MLYRKGWMAKQKAIEDLHGNWEQSCHDLPKLLNVMKIFLNRFIVQKKTRPLYNQQGEIVQVDGTFLYGKYKGTLLVVMA
uniref:Uncharacterized protein n=1 Tax=Cajanus cajan TaxID=3821 RepID=A0A151TZE4_CAJCA|nr:hypothetical protein KK1_004942 [Cajanus cajan]